MTQETAQGVPGASILATPPGGSCSSNTRVQTHYGIRLTGRENYRPIIVFVGVHDDCAYPTWWYRPSHMATQAVRSPVLSRRAGSRGV